tara:strand:- start:34 stop:879 length:846 start_codon:yes stop_codon:yes gene_type:complete
VPCLSSTAPQYGYVFILEAQLASGRIQRSLSPIGDFPQALVPTTAESEESAAIVAQIDVFTVRTAPSKARLTVLLATPHSEAFFNHPALLTISIQGTRQATSCSLSLPANATIVVPPKSQMTEDPKIASRICSPTSLSMVLDSFGNNTKPAQLAHSAYHPQHDLYGVWPANIHAASRWKALGYLLHFPSWDAARYLLSAGLPIIASVRYKEGELTQAAISATHGHLLVVRGFDENWVETNDPAAPSGTAVQRSYRLAEFLEVWLGRGGLGYILLPLATFTK